MREQGKPYRAGPRRSGPTKTPEKKKPVNLSIDVELLREAKAAGANLSAIFETALREQLRDLRSKKWHGDNDAAIEKSNAQLERDGMWYEPKWLRK